AGDGEGIEVQVGEDLGHLLAVDDVVLAGVPLLPGVRELAELVGARDQPQVQPFGVGGELGEETAGKDRLRVLEDVLGSARRCCDRWQVRSWLRATGQLAQRSQGWSLAAVLHQSCLSEGNITS